MGDAVGGSGEADVAATEDPCRTVEAVFGEETNCGGVRVLGNNVSGEEDGKGGDIVVNGVDESVNSGGNRWPRQETLALLKIRSDMDSTFKDSTLKGPLWEDISRKLAELGYKRSAKKCKEKFENVYKYHKRTKDGRRAAAGAGKSDAKSYRFFQELEAFDHQTRHTTPPPPPKPQPNIIPTTTLPWKPNSIITTTNPIITTTTPTTTTNNSNANTTPLSNTLLFGLVPPNATFTATVTPPITKPPLVFTSPASSSSTASDEDLLPRHKKKRKWKDFFRRLTRQVMRKQEKMQARFFDAVAKFEAERAAREDTWRKQETTMLAREHDMLVNERSAAAAKDAAVISFLQKVSAGETDRRYTPKKPENNIPTNVSFSITKTDIVSVSPTIPPPTLNTSIVVSPSSASSSSRWPKAEVEALINLRTTLELKYQENSPKGPLWEEISAGMRRIGYDRSSKRCKEKWENINKYYKKVKDNNKRRAEDSKTCPYFHKLDALYREKRIKNNTILDGEHVHRDTGVNGGFGTEPLMVQPERQWPLQPENNSDFPMNSEEEDDEEDLEGDEDRDSSSTEVEVHHHSDEAVPVGRGETLVNALGRVSENKIIVSST